MPEPTKRRTPRRGRRPEGQGIPGPRPDDIAVVGVGCRFPGGVRDLDTLWDVLLQGRDVIEKVPADRWDESFFHDDPKNPGTTYCREGGFLDDIDRFDADFFGISPREAREMDPQQRLLLEVSWQAMEDAGVPRERWYGTRTSVHVGILASDYLLLHTKAAGTETIDPYFASGKEFSFAAGRIAYTFGLHGPTMSVNTACSSSLVAVHLACQALRNGEADTALAGGVNAIITPELTVFMGKVQALSPTGRCKPFDARADGIVRGEGCGIIVLKRYCDAVRDHDQVYGVIRGTAVNQDGHSAGLTAPNAIAQQALLSSALEAAGLTHDVPGYVEAHGTGTPLGDPLELAALTEVIGRHRPEDRKLIVGSHKANFGHMDSAAGIAGLLKTLLVLRHRTVPPQIHHKHPSPLVDWERSGIAVPTQATPLPTVDGDAVTGVSAFGLSGTNAHVLISTPPRSAPVKGRRGGDRKSGKQAAEEGPRGRTLLVSASTEEGLRDLAEDYRELLDRTPLSGTEPAGLDALLASAAVRRTHQRHRLAVVGETAQELSAALESFRGGERRASVAVGEAEEGQSKLVYVFSGQGSQYPGVALDLYESEPVVKEALDECDALFREHADWSLLDLLREKDPERIKATEVAQPVVFAVQVALARLWQSWGLAPKAVIGHSMGEVAAAVVAGALTLPEAARLIVARGRLMQQATGSGRMVAVELGAEEVTRRLGGRFPEVCVATVNGPTSVVIAGPPTPMEGAVAELRQSGANAVALPVTYAFHHPMMQGYGDELEAFLADLEPAEPTVPLFSTAGTAEQTTPRLDAAYWGRNLRDPVLFWPAVDRLLAEGNAVFVEIGAHPVLGRPLQAALTHRERTGPVVGSLARGKAAATTLAMARAKLHVAGVEFDWSLFHPGPVRPVGLPPHRWADQRYWLSGVERGRQTNGLLRSEGLSATIQLFDAQGRLVGEVPGGPVVTGTGPTGAAQPAAAPAAAAPAAQAPAPEAPVRPAESARPAPGKAPAPPGGYQRDQVAAAVQDALNVVLGHPPGKRLPRQRGFFELGIDSISVSELARRVQDALGCPLDGADVLSHASVESLTDYILTKQPEPPREQAAPVTGQAPAAVTTTYPPTAPEPIAIVGIGCRLPGGADSPESFWRLLSQRIDASGDVPTERWDAASLLADGKVTAGQSITGRGSFLDAVDGFDHGFFRISPREARSMDPQQRLFLEVAWESLEDAGIAVDRLRGGRTGVFVGLNTTDYTQLVTRNQSDIDLYYGTGNSFSGAAGRLSYFLGVRGPSIAVDTACSSSLTAIHLACQSLRAGESEVAIAGGANVMSTPTVFLAMSAAGALAPDGRCKTFDDSADGYGRGEGAGALVLKTLSRATRDGDRVYAVIRGSAVNQDGASGGLTVPSGEAQEEVIKTALDNAAMSADEIDYIEAHGTGTRLGDAIELRALAGAVGQRRPFGTPLLVGSVKTNVGHLEAAAGVTGLIKIVLSLRHEEIPAHLHVTKPTRQVAWDRLPLKVVTEPTPWPPRDRPRSAGVSAFGFTGTNAHVVIQEAPPVEEPVAGPDPRGSRPLVLASSGTTPAALRAAAASLRERVEAADEAELADLCWVSGARRTHLEHRFAVVGATREELVDGLTAVEQGEAAANARVATARPGEQRRLAVVYGSKPPGLPWAKLLGANTDGDGPSAEQLLGGPAAVQAFRVTVAEVDAALREGLGFSPVRAWESGAPAQGGLSETEDRALVFAAHLAATAVWAGLGVVPDAVVGYGLGEVAAAHAAGELELAEAVRLLADNQRPGDRGQPGNLPRYSAEAGWPGLATQLTSDGIEAVLDIGTGSPAVRMLSTALDGLRRDGQSPEVLVLSAGAENPRGTVCDADELLAQVAALHAYGCRVDWDLLVPGGHRLVSLPSYPWQRKRHWIEAPKQAQGTGEPAGSGQPGRPTPAANGAPANGGRLNGTVSNGVQLNGSKANGASANGGRPGTAYTNGSSANGSPPNGTSASNGAPPTHTAPGTAAGTGLPQTPLVAELTPLGPEDRGERMLEVILGLVSEVLGGDDDVAPEQGFFDLGLDSVLSAELKERAEDAIGRELPGTIMFECPNARSFAEFVLEDVFGEEPAAEAPTGAITDDEATTDDSEPDDGLDDLSDDALMGRLLSALSSSESMLTEGDLP
jgi:acyl transferase domain-containing protein/acyl carrier protein